MAAAVLAESDEAGERCHRGAQPAYVDRDEQMAVVGGKARKQNGGRDVADDLAGRRADKQRRQRDERAECALHRRDPRQVAGEHEKRAESEQQTVIHFKERARLENEERDGDDGKPDIEREHAENYEHRQREKHEIDDRAPHGWRGDFGRFERHGFGLHEQACSRDEDERDGERYRHDRKKLTCSYRIVGIKVQILRITEGSEHTAEVGGDVLHDEYECGVLLFAARGQRKPAERQEGNERHVVGHDHGAEIRHENEREGDAAHVSERGDDPGRQPLEEVPLFECGNDGERTEKAGQRVKIEIIRISRIRRHETACHRRRNDGDDQNGVALQHTYERIETVMRAPALCNRTHTE